MFPQNKTLTIYDIFQNEVTFYIFNFKESKQSDWVHMQIEAGRSKEPDGCLGVSVD